MANPQQESTETHNFIDDALVCMEIEGEAGIAIHQSLQLDVTRKALKGTHYFSIRPRDALLVVFVLTRPWGVIIRMAFQ